MHRVRFLVVLLSTLLLSAGGVRAAQAQDDGPRVHAVLFFSPTCGHCHKVITEDLPPLVDAYGNKLLILAIDVSQDNGRQLYLSAIEQFGVPPDRMAVPMLIVGDRVLVGSGEIPAEFPQLIQVGLAMGGIPWPEIPGLDAAIASLPPAEMEAATTNPATPTALPTLPTPTPMPLPGLPTVTSGFAHDPIAFLLAALVLIALVATLPLAWFTFRRRRNGTADVGAARYAIPILAAFGLGISIYLLFVETTGTQAACGPVGECNLVQQSSYARLFGLVPIAALGVLMQLAILGLWLITALRRNPWSRRASYALAILTSFGLLFSIYLTSVELFVIGAICAWCLTSAVIVGAECWIAAALAGASARPALTPA
jgi:uncharacterized membrane protein/thiol-disulfide isomerase/thioredoxin